MHSVSRFRRDPAIIGKSAYMQCRLALSDGLDRPALHQKRDAGLLSVTHRLLKANAR